MPILDQAMNQNLTRQTRGMSPLLALGVGAAAVEPTPIGEIIIAAIIASQALKGAAPGFQAQAPQAPTMPFPMPSFRPPTGEQLIPPQIQEMLRGVGFSPQEAPDLSLQPFPGELQEPTISLAEVEKANTEGLVVANVGADGKIYKGEEGDLHFNLSERFGDKIRKKENLKAGDATWIAIGFVDKEGNFFSREEALKKVKVRPTGFPDELDAMDLREQATDFLSRKIRDF